MESSYHNHNQIIAYNSVSDLMSDLAQGNLDMIVLNNVFTHNLTSNYLYNLKLLGPNVPLGEGYGIIALPDKVALIKKINQAILSIQKWNLYLYLSKIL